MPAYYVQWHMMQAWRPLIYADEEQQAKASRDPVAPAKRSASAMQIDKPVDSIITPAFILTHYF
ncbi:MAG: hypothetical protein R6W78_17810 [Bacteroidales bacterium]